MSGLVALSHPWADAAILALLGAFAGWACFRRPDRVLPVLAIALCGSAFYLLIGTKWQPAKLVALVVGLAFLVRAVVRPPDRRLFLRPGWHLVFAGLVVVASIYGALAAPAFQDVGQGAFRQPVYRSLVQGASYLIVLVFFLVPLYLVPRLREPVRGQRWFILGATLSATYAVYQVIAYVSGWPFRGIQYWTDRTGVGAVRAGGALLFRANGLAYEPKELAAVALVAAVAALSYRLANREGRRYACAALLCVAGFVAALSGGGLLGLMIYVLLAAGWSAYDRRLRAIAPSTRFLVAVGALGVVGMLAMGLTGSPVRVVGDLTWSRVSLLPSVLDASGPGGVRIEHHLLAYLVEHPARVLFGFGPGNYSFVLADRLTSVHRLGIEPIVSTYARLLADLGVLGPLLVIGLVLALGRRVHAVLKRDRRLTTVEAAALQSVWQATLAAAAVMAFVDVFDIFLFFGGITAGMIQRVRLMESAPVPVLAASAGAVSSMSRRERDDDPRYGRAAWMTGGSRREAV